MAPSKKRGAGKAVAAARHDWQVGDLVLAKVKGFPPWPAQISTPDKWGQSHDPKKIFVYFFGTYQIGYCSPDGVQAFTLETKKSLLSKCKGRETDFVRAVEQIIEAYDTQNKEQNKVEGIAVQEIGVDGKNTMEKSNRRKSNKQHMLAQEADSQAFSEEDVSWTNACQMVDGNGNECDNIFETSNVEKCRTTTVDFQDDKMQLSDVEKKPNKFKIQKNKKNERKRTSTRTLRSGSEKVRSKVTNDSLSTSAMHMKANAGKIMKGTKKLSMMNISSEREDGKDVAKSATESLNVSDSFCGGRVSNSLFEAPKTVSPEAERNMDVSGNTNLEQHEDTLLETESVCKEECKVAAHKSVDAKVTCAHIAIASGEVTQRGDSMEFIPADISCKETQATCKYDGDTDSTTPEKGQFTYVFKKKRKHFKKCSQEMSSSSTEVAEQGQVETMGSQVSSPGFDSKYNVAKLGIDNDDHLPLVKRVRARLGKECSRRQEESEDSDVNNTETTSFVQRGVPSSMKTNINCTDNDRGSSEIAHPLKTSVHYQDYATSSEREPSLPLKADKYRLRGSSADDEASLPPSKRLHRALEAMSAFADDHSGSDESDTSARGASIKSKERPFPVEIYKDDKVKVGDDADSGARGCKVNQKSEKSGSNGRIDFQGEQSEFSASMSIQTSDRSHGSTAIMSEQRTNGNMGKAIVVDNSISDSCFDAQNKVLTSKKEQDYLIMAAGSPEKLKMLHVDPNLHSRALENKAVKGLFERNADLVTKIVESNSKKAGKEADIATLETCSTWNGSVYISEEIMDKNKRKIVLDSLEQAKHAEESALINKNRCRIQKSTHVISSVMDGSSAACHITSNKEDENTGFHVSVSGDIQLVHDDKDNSNIDDQMAKTVFKEQIVPMQQCHGAKDVSPEKLQSIEDIRERHIGQYDSITDGKRAHFLPSFHDDLECEEQNIPVVSARTSDHIGPNSLQEIHHLLSEGNFKEAPSVNRSRLKHNHTDVNASESCNMTFGLTKRNTEPSEDADPFVSKPTISVLSTNGIPFQGKCDRTPAEEICVGSRKEVSFRLHTADDRPKEQLAAITPLKHTEKSFDDLSKSRESLDLEQLATQKKRLTVNNDSAHITVLKTSTSPKISEELHTLSQTEDTQLHADTYNECRKKFFAMENQSYGSDVTPNGELAFISETNEKWSNTLETRKENLKESSPTQSLHNMLQAGSACNISATDLKSWFRNTGKVSPIASKSEDAACHPHFNIDQKNHIRNTYEAAKERFKTSENNWSPLSTSASMKCLIAAAQAKRQERLSVMSSPFSRKQPNSFSVSASVSPVNQRGGSQCQHVGSIGDNVIAESSDEGRTSLRRKSVRGMLDYETEAIIARDSFEGMLETLSRTKESIARATRVALECAKYGLAGEVIDLLVRKLECEQSYRRKVDLFFLVDSITQLSHSQKGVVGNAYSSAVQHALPRLLSAAAPSGSTARENRRQCLKVLRLWLERKILPEPVIRKHMNAIESGDDRLHAILARRPSRVARALDDPFREIEGMLDEYGSNASFQLSGFLLPQVSEDEEDINPSRDNRGGECSPKRNGEASNEKINGFTPEFEKHRHVLEDVEGELEMEDVSPSPGSDAGFGHTITAEGHRDPKPCQMNNASIMTNGSQYSPGSMERPPPPTDPPPSTPPLPVSPPPSPPPPPPTSPPHYNPQSPSLSGCMLPCPTYQDAQHQNLFQIPHQLQQGNIPVVDLSSISYNSQRYVLSGSTAPVPAPPYGYVQSSQHVVQNCAPLTQQLHSNNIGFPQVCRPLPPPIISSNQFSYVGAEPKQPAPQCLPERPLSPVPAYNSQVQSRSLYPEASDVRYEEQNPFQARHESIATSNSGTNLLPCNTGVSSWSSWRCS